MMVRMRVLAGLSLASWLVLACGVEAAVPPMTPQAQKIEVAKADPRPGAQLIGPIEASHGSGCGLAGRKGTFEGAMNALREVAANKGADYVTLISVTEPHSENGCFDQEFKLRGMAYKLGSGGPAERVAKAEPAPAASECNPVCSPGFACHSGICEPQCNPPCGEGQKCGPDRLCAPASPEPKADATAPK